MNPALRTLRRVGYWVAAVAALLLVINVGDRILQFSTDTAYFQRPFEISADLGEDTQARTFSAAVISTRGAGAITERGGARPHETTGVWVIVTVRVTAQREPMSIGYCALRDAQGRLYWDSDRIKQGVHGGYTLQPGVPIEGEVAFEVPRDVAAGKLTVLLGERPIDHRMDALIAVYLDRVDRATVDTWAADKQATLAPTKVVG